MRRSPSTILRMIPLPVPGRITPASRLPRPLPPRRPGAPTSRHRARPSPAIHPCVPRSATWPPSRTTIWSAWTTVGQTVRDDQGGPPALDRLERGEDVRLVRLVRARWSLSSRIRIGGFFSSVARDRHALLFAARQFQPALADAGRIALGLALDEVGDGRALRGAFDIGLVGALAAIGDVVADGLVEQHRICGTMPIAARTLSCANCRHRLAVDGDRAGIHVVRSR